MCSNAGESKRFAKMKAFQKIFISFFIIYIFYWKSSVTDDWTPYQPQFARKPTLDWYAQVTDRQRYYLWFDDSKDVNFNQLGYQLRFWKSLLDSSSNEDLLRQIDDQLFSWILPGFSSSLQMRNSFNGSGIVICVYDNYVPLALSTLQMIRKVLKSNFPVEVFYMGDEDLSRENQDLLTTTISNLVTRNLFDVFDKEIIQVWGWAIKAFALMACSFQHAMLLDADVILLQPPESLLSSRLYQTHGALFFQDRTMISARLEETKMFIDRFSPKPIRNELMDLRLFRDMSSHQQESGVVLIDKKARFAGLMATCMLNVGPYRHETYKYMYGDKETFWIGFEGVQDDYAWNPFLPGSIGSRSQDREDSIYEICSSQIIHVDENETPIFFNGGLLENKLKGDHAIGHFREYLLEEDKKKDLDPFESESAKNSWKMGMNNHACISSSKAPISLRPELQEQLQAAGDILKSIID